MSTNNVKRQIIKTTGGSPILRDGFTTDNGNLILDIHNLKIKDPKRLENQLNNIVGVVTNGLFAARSADILLLGTTTGVQTTTPLIEN